MTDNFFCFVTYIQVKQIIEQEKEKIVGWGLHFIGCCLDGGRSVFELAVNCKKGVEFMWTK